MKEIEIVGGLTVDEKLTKDLEICLNVSAQYGEESYIFLKREHVEKLLSMFDK